MADPICRWRNSSIKQLIEFNSIFPLLPIEKSQGREYVEKNWKLFGGNNFFTAPYQLAAQMGMYYENESFMYPRFHKLITIEEAYLYLQYWGKNYYAPNPYTKSILQEKAVVINNFLVNWVKDKGSTASFSEALREMFSSEIGNADILINMLNNFSEVQIEGDIVSLKETSTARYSDSDVWLEIDQNDKEAFFRFVCKDKYHGRLPYNASDEPLQLIYYGAPGTGKSHSIDGVVSEDNSVRTTFHPDSDYASFVGAYKPTMASVAMSAFVGKEVHKAQPQGGHPGTEQKIVYKYVPQAFLKAYVQAWAKYNPENDEPYYLVIEEINRGNCAQIFGDLFQLLDRNNMGASSYPISADDDIEQFLATDEKGFAGFSEEQKDVIRNFVLVKDNGKTESIGQSILNGSKLLLPPNLRIWATMNTSDQSLFPIDSAFKRRWNWKYMPIEYNPVDHNGNIISWSFKIGKSQYSWGTFLEKINPEIYTLTESSDKQMGYFFAKADPQTGIISEDVFLNKVLFYLWTDVFKDYDVSSVIFKNKKENRSFRFTDFFEDPEALGNFIENLGLKPIGGHDDTNEDASSEESKSSLKFKVGESFPIPQRKLALTALEQYVNNNPDITAEELITEWEPLSNVPHFIESEEEHQKTIATATSFEERTQKVELQNGDIVYVSLHGWIPKTSQELMDAVNAKDWGIDISILSE